MGRAKASNMATVKFAPYIKSAHDQGIHDAIVIKTSEVYTAPWVRMKCQFGCAGLW